jgi:DNA-directed RNA polymerase specialized sigma24 family protein
MTENHAIRSRYGNQHSTLKGHKPASHEQPGAFQLTFLRALELPKTSREVFLLKEIQGYTFAEIAAILGISIDAACARWDRARREFMHLGDSDAMERAQ